MIGVPWAGETCRTMRVSGHLRLHIFEVGLQDAVKTRWASGTVVFARRNGTIRSYPCLATVGLELGLCPTC